MEMRLVTLSLILTAVAADNASSLRLKRKTTTVAEIDSFFNQVDSKNGMVKAENIETYPWTTKQQFSMDPVSTEPRAPPTLSPVAVTEDCQNVDREEAMLDVLSDLTPKEQLTNSITPQGMAYQWILKADEAQINPCMDPDRARQRYALAVMYYSTGGDSWIDNTNWLEGSNSECQWTKVTCHQGTMRIGALMLCKFCTMLFCRSTKFADKILGSAHDCNP